MPQGGGASGPGPKDAAGRQAAGWGVLCTSIDANQVVPAFSPQILPVLCPHVLPKSQTLHDTAMSPGTHCRNVASSHVTKYHHHSVHPGRLLLDKKIAGRGTNTSER